MSELGTFENIYGVESFRCGICGGVQKAALVQDHFDYLQCVDCGLNSIRQCPTAQELARFYADSYEVDRERYKVQVQRNGPKYLREIERGLFNDSGDSRSILEVGSSWGHFLALAQSVGWQAKGIELSPRSSAWARSELSLDVFTGRLEECPYIDSGQFSAVVSWHVIEHVIDPLGFVKLLRSCLRPGGKLGIRTPNVASVPAKFNGRCWEWFGAPAHLWLFTPAALTKTVEAAGFKVESVSTTRGDAHNPVFELVRGTALRLGLHHSAKRFFGIGRASTSQGSTDEASGGTMRSKKLESLDHLFDRVCFPLWPIELLLDALRRGPDLMLIARRVD